METNVQTVLPYKRDCCSAGTFLIHKAVNSFSRILSRVFLPYQMTRKRELLHMAFDESFETVITLGQVVLRVQSLLEQSKLLSHKKTYCKNTVIQP